MAKMIIYHCPFPFRLQNFVWSLYVLIQTTIMAAMMKTRTVWTPMIQRTTRGIYRFLMTEYTLVPGRFLMKFLDLGLMMKSIVTMMI